MSDVASCFFISACQRNGVTEKITVFYPAFFFVFEVYFALSFLVPSLSLIVSLCHIAHSLVNIVLHWLSFLCWERHLQSTRVFSCLGAHETCLESEWSLSPQRRIFLC